MCTETEVEVFASELRRRELIRTKDREVPERSSLRQGRQWQRQNETGHAWSTGRE
jgi:hypothetical protein